MTDNSNLAGIERDAVRRTTQRHIIEALEHQLGNVPHDLKALVISITDLGRLDMMFDNAVSFESLDAID